jgi:hypothetical protein
MCCTPSVALRPSYRAVRLRLFQQAGGFQPTRGVHVPWMAVARLEIVDGLSRDRGQQIGVHLLHRRSSCDKFHR